MWYVFFFLYNSCLGWTGLILRLVGVWDARSAYAMPTTAHPHKKGVTLKCPRNHKAVRLSLLSCFCPLALPGR
jgi:hypothetical protein